MNTVKLVLEVAVCAGSGVGLVLVVLSVIDVVSELVRNLREL
jgi:Na+-transporting methylmalonyl-CoA/oxaloacetate decarboxylase gamma subunit